MASLSTLLRYIGSKIEYSLSLSTSQMTTGEGLAMNARRLDTILKHLLVGKLTFLHRDKGEEMAPTIGSKGGTLLIRKIPAADPTKVYVGDVIMLKDPMSSDKYLVRRLAATEGYEMASTDQTDEPFVIEKDQCWVVADNEHLKPKEAYDSRTFGPVSMTNIVGRVIYHLRSSVDHGPVNNSLYSLKGDSPVLEMELDVDEMRTNHKE